MNYTLYISENCESCLRVIAELSAIAGNLEVINLDKKKESAPKNLLIIPALFSGSKLVAYGTDIVEFMRKAG